MYPTLQFNLIGKPTINKDHLVMNVSNLFSCPNQLGQKMITYIRHTFLYDYKFGDYCELPYWILFTA